MSPLLDLVMRRLEVQVEGGDPLSVEFARWLGVYYGEVPTGVHASGLWSPRAVALAGLQEASGKATVNPFSAGLAALRSREFFVPHSPGVFEADPLAILSVAVGVRHIVDRDAGKWIAAFACRAMEAESDSWRMSMLSAVAAVVDVGQPAVLSPELAVALAARGIGDFDGPVSELALSAALELRDVSAEQAAVRLAVLRVLTLSAGRARRPSFEVMPVTQASVPEERPRIDVGIITIKEEEFSAVLEHFSPNLELHRRGKRRDYEVARIDTPGDPCHVAITRCITQGTGQAQTAATDLLDDLAPAYVIVVGIAGGVPTTDFTLGDVLVSTFIHDLTLEDTGTGSPRFNATGGPLHPEASRIVARLPALAKPIGPWTATVTAPRPPYDGVHTTENHAWNMAIDEAFAYHRNSGRAVPIARAESIASSNRLVKDPDLVAGWRTIIKGISAVEMEAAGVYAVCQPRHVPCFAIRGISDIIGWRRDEQWTLYACVTAAAYARGLIGSGVLRYTPT
ncbi:phosphorylase family protein [Sorangium sp. So ce1151]|uniref:5'-methylthioadenosine/S-adenosylhomocysteine nucleosidase family protein n=1 Tax=Sorangium sp. So ce1151 TaxID=3133332 RepID=UPI003F61AC7D